MQIPVRKKITVTVVQANKPQRFSTTRINTPDFDVFVSSSNTSANVYIGSADVDSSWIPRAKGSLYSYVHGTGVLLGGDPVVDFDLSEFYVFGANAGDTIIVEYFDRGIRR